MECDGYEKRDEPLALIGETDDLAERALLLSQWSRDLIVFTNGVGTSSEADEAPLAARGIRVERRAIADVMGDRRASPACMLVDGEVIRASGGFVRPLWTATARLRGAARPSGRRQTAASRSTPTAAPAGGRLRGGRRRPRRARSS